MKSKLIFKLLIIICIITLIISCNLFFRERIILDLNAENKEYVSSILDEYIDNTENLTKVAYGREWNNGYIYVYSLLDNTEALLISEGEFSKDKLAEYIKGNGYNEKNIGICLGVISIIIIIFCFIKLKLKRNKTFYSFKLY